MVDLINQVGKETPQKSYAIKQSLITLLNKIM